jgi:hypothetical protein
VSFETVHKDQQGFSIELRLAWHAGASAGDVIFDSRENTADKSISGSRGGSGSGRGIAVVVPADGGLSLILSGSTPNTTFSGGARDLVNQTITMDPGCARLIASDDFEHHVTIIADA